jgi:hypothetical protein
MSRRYETRTPEPRPHQVCVERKCELCGKAAHFPEAHDGSWSEKSSYDVATVQVSYEEGSSFPEGKMAEKVSFDICPQCFKDVLVPFLQEKGAKPTVEDTGW